MNAMKQISAFKYVILLLTLDVLKNSGRFSPEISFGISEYRRIFMSWFLSIADKLLKNGTCLV